MEKSLWKVEYSTSSVREPQETNRVILIATDVVTDLSEALTLACKKIQERYDEKSYLVLVNSISIHGEVSVLS